MRRIAFDLKDYAHIDYGYASTIHRAQGQTVARSYVLASRSFDRHAAYVALSRHTEEATLYYAREEMRSYSELARVLARARPKDLALDYDRVERENLQINRVLRQQVPTQGRPEAPVTRSIDEAPFEAEGRLRQRYQSLCSAVA